MTEAEKRGPVRRFARPLSVEIPRSDAADEPVLSVDQLFELGRILDAELEPFDEFLRLPLAFLGRKLDPIARTPPPKDRRQ
ncbi:hypothetical protein RHE_CH02685 [Rhizobium etli CFN 42]|uniref:Uncharacterized protein n=1 Tax=Rhizobium etli (strain ATCC 51251 / DSM 11541 / JCM 21823 / NBRC 15573 / CFN 42) TaxID=347834 RepID=Q2K6T0_RHIEC|nr:hypothetical protein RHE_CH02685 [Rhizobium etli CFN 42]